MALAVAHEAGKPVFTAALRQALGSQCHAICPPGPDLTHCQHDMPLVSSRQIVPCGQPLSPHLSSAALMQPPCTLLSR